MTSRLSWGKRKAVLAVNVPGREPYAVLDPRFKRPRNKADVLGAGLPALVSTTDPNDIEILWDEVPSLESQVEQRLSDAMQGQDARMDEARQMQRQMWEAAQNAGASPPAPGAETPQGAPAMEAMAQSAKQALQFVKDPAMRKTMIEQYRAAGIPVDEEDEAS
jgi:hypothetical protein